MFQFVKASIDKLADFPALGRPGRRPGTRELVIDRSCSSSPIA
jgi:plasmid stabilization system protein ParE